LKETDVRECSTASASVPDVGASSCAPERIAFSVEVETHDKRRVRLMGLRMPNEGRQPLILWPGFYQNGFVYDLRPNGGSLAEYLWVQGFEVWIIHSRGTGGSSGRWHSCSLDDFAASDIPAVIEYVAQRNTRKPIYVGHSQGGNTALMSLMGACKLVDGTVFLSDEHAEARQSKLKALVTLGSFLDFTFSKRSSLQDFAQKGVVLNLFGRRLHIINSSLLLKLTGILTFIPIPVGLTLRQKMLARRSLRMLLAPLTLTLNFFSRLTVWEFLYHIPNVSDADRRYLFYKTLDATFWRILAQHYRAVKEGAMWSFDRSVNYSASYHRLWLPVSFVSMELDSLADPLMMKEAMFKAVSSSEKSYAEWEGQGHEDFFMRPEYFPQALEAIRKVC
jgi:pimeloyl-ACP methyl ester carboxylesterase